MNKNIRRNRLLAAFFAVLIFSGCNKNDEPEIPVNPSEFLYVLNSGSMGGNNASLSIYDIEKKTVTQNYFERQNGRKLGDTGQDMLVYGSKLYIAMTDESTVEITDLEAKSIKQIKTEGQPRAFAAHGGKIYVTYFNGYVARIDTATLNVEGKVRVGRSPEQLAVAGGKLYVANSGGLDYATIGYDKTVSVIDIQSFTETKKIEVVVNPRNMSVDNQGNIFLVSTGNYDDIPATLQKIDTKTDQVSVIQGITCSYITVVDNILYAIHGVYNEKGKPTYSFYSYNISNNTVISNNFIGNTTISHNPEIVSDKTSGEIYITSSDYINTGDVYVFDKNGSLLYRFEAGLNPGKVVRIAK